MFPFISFVCIIRMNEYKSVSFLVALSFPNRTKEQVCIIIVGAVCFVCVFLPSFCPSPFFYLYSLFPFSLFPSYINMWHKPGWNLLCHLMKFNEMRRTTKAGRWFSSLKSVFLTQKLFYMHEKSNSASNYFTSLSSVIKKIHHRKREI